MIIRKLIFLDKMLLILKKIFIDLLKINYFYILNSKLGVIKFCSVWFYKKK
jgi:hypothetical protein